MVDQRIDHIFFRPGRENQQVLIEDALGRLVVLGAVGRSR
jgi:hypothetical protein